MSTVLAGLAPVQLERIAAWLERSRQPDEAVTSVEAFEFDPLDEPFAGELRAHVNAMGRTVVAYVLRAVAVERREAIQAADRRLELVWTGPERDATGTRDTSVVVRELFQSADRDVLVAGYALFNARAIFEPLAERMSERPGLRVRLFLNVARGAETRSDEELTSEFARRLRAHHWPAGRLPEVYFDPRSLNPRPELRAVMHAKCVQVDDQRSFVTSANLTEAAQVRNIELGVVINDSTWCRAVRQQFDDLVDRGELRRLELLR